MAELERLRKQNAELLEWNRYYLEVTKERRKQVEELQAEVDRLRTMVDEAMGYLSIGESRPANRYLAEALGVDENYHGYFGDDDDE